MSVVIPKTAHDSAAVTRKRLYHKPTLALHGAVRDLTLGGSPGTGESANPGHKKHKRSILAKDDWINTNP